MKLLVFLKFQYLLDLVLNSSNSRNPCNACLTQPSFGAEMFPPNQRSKPIFRKNAEHYVAYNALHAIYHDTISCNQGWGQVQLVKYSSTSSTRNQVQVQVQVL